MNPSPASSTGAPAYAVAPGAPPAAAGASFGADCIPGKDIVAGGGCVDIGNIFTGGMPAGAGILAPAAGGGGTNPCVEA